MTKVRTILYAEDDLVVLTVYKKRLEAAGFHVIPARAEPGGEVAVGQVLGRSGSFSTPGCAKDAYAGRGVGKPEGLPVAPCPQLRLRVKFGQRVVAYLHPER